MSGYRRFVAYVYEYLKGKKENNCGFIKVEEREQQCRIELHLHCPGLPADLPCKIYGFIRKDGLMNGILLEILNTRPDAIEGFIETDSASMNASGISLDQLNGMLFLTESGSFLGTQWDDLPIRPEDFREIKPDHQSEPNVEASEQSEEQSEEPPESPGSSDPTKRRADGFLSIGCSSGIHSILSLFTSGFFRTLYRRLAYQCLENPAKRSAAFSIAA